MEQFPPHGIHLVVLHKSEPLVAVGKVEVYHDLLARGVMDKPGEFLPVYLEAYDAALRRL